MKTFYLGKIKKNDLPIVLSTSNMLSKTTLDVNDLRTHGHRRKYKQHTMKLDTFFTAQNLIYIRLR